MGVARFSFDDLCAQPLAAADYLRIAHEFHTIILDHIPVMDYAQRNEAKRFIILIDTLYDNAVKLLASAQAAAGRALRRRPRLSRPRIQAHRLAPDRDAVAGLSRPAAWPAAGPDCRRRENCRDFTVQMLRPDQQYHRKRHQHRRKPTQDQQPERQKDQPRFAFAGNHQHGREHDRHRVRCPLITAVQNSIAIGSILGRAAPSRQA